MKVATDAAEGGSLDRGDGLRRRRDRRVLTTGDAWWSRRTAVGPRAIDDRQRDRERLARRALLAYVFVPEDVEAAVGRGDDLALA